MTGEAYNKLLTKYQAKIIVLLEAGVLDLRNTQVELNFDPDGNIGTIRTHSTVYTQSKGQKTLDKQNKAYILDL